MLKKLLIIAILFLTIQEINAQGMKGIVKRKTAETSFFANLGVYDGEYWGAGANIHYMWGIGRNKQRFNIGLGLRQYNFSAKKREYVTSDADLVSKLKNGTDSIYFDKQFSALLNGYLAFQFHIKRGVEFGLNVDLGGITFGGTKQGEFHSYELTLTERSKKDVQPTAFNFNPFFTNAGIGSSFNEAYFQFSAGNIMKYRLGFDYFINEVRTTVPITGNGTRFKTTNYMVMGAIVWNIRHHQTRYDLWNMHD